MSSFLKICNILIHSKGGKFLCPPLSSHQLYFQKWLHVRTKFSIKKTSSKNLQAASSYFDENQAVGQHNNYESPMLPNAAAANSERSHSLFMLGDKYPASRCPLNVEVTREVKHGRLNKHIYLTFVLKCQQSGSKSIFFLKKYKPTKTDKTTAARPFSKQQSRVPGIRDSQMGDSLTLRQS